MTGNVSDNGVTSPNKKSDCVTNGSDERTEVDGFRDYEVWIKTEVQEGQSDLKRKRLSSSNDCCPTRSKQFSKSFSEEKNFLILKPLNPESLEQEINSDLKFTSNGRKSVDDFSAQNNVDIISQTDESTQTIVEKVDASVQTDSTSGTQTQIEFFLI